MYMKRLTLFILVLAGSVYGEPECNQPDGYDPYQSYYPYWRIYQDSRVRNPQSDYEDNYWPSKRDDNLIDALTK